MGAPSVTVCIPTYNYAHYLGGAIESVLAQTYEDFELLIADDVSTDDTEAIVSRYLDDPRVRFMPNERNSGMFANFNRCIDAARGRYIKFLMADDQLAVEFLEQMVALLDVHPEVSLATTGGWLIDGDGNPFAEEVQNLGPGPLVPRERVVYESAVGFNAVGMPSCTLIRTDAIRTAGGFDANYQPSSDIALWFTLLATTDACFIPECLTFLRIHDTHTHEWGDEPQEIFFKVWQDAAAAEPSAVSQKVADFACRRWSVRFMIFAAKHLSRGHFGRARELVGIVHANVGIGWSLLEGLRRLPQLIRDRVVTQRANARGQALRYDPYPRPNGDLAAMRAAAEAARRPRDANSRASAEAN